MKKVGLALSGGGLRAAYFHAGVLARLAENDILKEINVISCVSGGAIAGAIYISELDKRIAKQKNGILTKNDYIEVVKNTIDKLDLVGSINFRTVRFLGERNNINIQKSESDWTNYLDKISLFKKEDGSSLLITDMDKSLPSTILPTLIINTINLNSGELWALKPSHIDTPTKKIEYTDFETNFLLAEAVYASSAFPGFSPITLKLKKEGSSCISLADGGIIDNLGLQTLINENCNEFYISDGGLHLTLEDTKDYTIPNVLSRANQIIMERNHIQLMEKLNKLSGVTSFYINMNTNQKLNEFSPEEIDSLSNIRTDLDYFSEVEQDSLSLLGYCITSMTVGKNCNTLEWEFKKIIQWKAINKKKYKKHIETGRYRTLRHIRHYINTSTITKLILVLLILTALMFIFTKIKWYGLILIPLLIFIFILKDFILLALLGTTLLLSSIFTFPIAIHSYMFSYRSGFRGYIKKRNGKLPKKSN